MADRQQAAAVTRQRIALGPAERRLVGLVVLAEGAAEEGGERDVQPVEPDHRRGRLVAVVVPGPARRDDEIARLHGRLLALDRGVGAAAFDDEAQRALGVAVRRSHLARHDELQPGVQGVRDLRGALQPGVLEDQHPALGLFRADVLGRFEHRRPYLGIGPAVRHTDRRRDRRHQRFEPGPQRCHVLRMDAFVVRASDVVAARHVTPP